MLVPGLNVVRRQLDGCVTVDSFPDETDVCEAAVAQLDPWVVRIERRKLHISVANGEAVYVPVGRAALRGCTRYGRLYLRLSRPA